VGKLILISILIATVALPMRAARDPSPTRGLRRAVLWIVAFNVCYLIAIVYILPRVS
jgi:hypothetical protein